MGFLFVDRIYEMDAGKYVRGIKHITPQDAYLMKNAQGLSSMMPSIIGETLGQLGAWSVMAASDFQYRPVAGVVAQATIHGQALPGETLDLETTIDSWDPKAIQYHAVARVAGKPVFSIDSALGPMLPMSDFIDPALAEQQFHAIYRPGHYEPMQEGYCPDWLEQSPKTCRVASFDRILAWEPGEFAVAVKEVSLSAPYFVDHFPRKPVLPLTILLSSKLELASQFLLSSVKKDPMLYQAQAVRRVKMSGFVQPGDTLKTTMMLKKQDDSEVIFSFKSEVDGKRVCIAEAVFAKQRNDA